MSTSNPEEVAEFLRVTNLTNVAFLAIAGYDWLICLPREVTQFWGPRLTHRIPDAVRSRDWGTLASQAIVMSGYILVRYLPLGEWIVVSWLRNTPPTLDPSACKVVGLSITINSALGSVGANIIMFMRCIALFYRDRTLLLGLTALLFANISLIMWGASNVAPVLGNCLPRKSSNGLYAWYISTVVFDIIVVGLTIYKVTLKRREHGKSSLLKLLLRDGIFYLVGICACNLLVLGFEVQNVKPLYQTAVSAVGPLGTSILAARVTLNLHEAIKNASDLSSGGGVKGNKASGGGGGGGGHGVGTGTGLATGLSGGHGLLSGTGAVKSSSSHSGRGFGSPILQDFGQRSQIHMTTEVATKIDGAGSDMELGKIGSEYSPSPREPVSVGWGHNEGLGDLPASNRFAYSVSTIPRAV